MPSSIEEGINLYETVIDMAFCGAIPTSMTDTALQATFTSTNGSPSLMGSANLASAERTERGLLTSSATMAAVKALKAQGLIPTPPKIDATSVSETGPIEAYMKQDKTFVDNVKAEYCFYDGRYRYALQQLIKGLQQGYTDSNTTNQKTIQNYLKITQGLNRTLNDMTQIMNQITQQRKQETKDQSTSINSLNQELVSRGTQLSAQNDILQKEQGAANLYKEMVKFTREKANYANNMLALYSFLNITALGLLFYIYRSAGEA